MIKVGIIGASGMAGSAIYKLANQQADLEVTGIIRDKDKAEKVLGKDAHLLVGDVLTMDDALLKDFDVIVDAFGTAPKDAAQQIDLAKKLINLSKGTKQRIIFILGAGSLHTGDDDHLVVEDIEKMAGSDAWLNTPKQQLKELEYLRGVNDVDWVGISPSMMFEAGPEAAEYALGGDDLLYNDKGESKVTSGTMARLVVNEILHPTHHQERITIIDK
ncbi:NAD(P)-dependent oxidoreductase [Lactobacillus sp. PV034]|uniref:NAD(P)-dependent oxidoreductase n=1 Tax=Lactobacillus sp. PV034 TaxID=2594495 RepID=UPI002240185A|nr:NAD(P)H-binding protein [Lactobacillus sp. PV034]QNQ81123.1 NADH-flavin reductase [Lactobacillus sp. PV034]